jgi:hypothetical protein
MRLFIFVWRTGDLPIFLIDAIEVVRSCLDHIWFIDMRGTTLL